MSQRWALQLAIEGDLRFGSHLDLVRCVERTAARGALPVSFSQGFNPHPLISLVYPKPVGITALDDLAVLCLSEPMQAEDLLRRMNDHAPHGMRFLRAKVLEGRNYPRVQEVSHELRLENTDRDRVTKRLDDLSRAPSWPIERIKPSKKPNRRARRQTIDLKNMVESITIDDNTLRWKQRPRADMLARAGEVLELVGMDASRSLADVIRTEVKYSE